MRGRVGVGACARSKVQAAKLQKVHSVHDHEHDERSNIVTSWYSFAHTGHRLIGGLHTQSSLLAVFCILVSDKRYNKVCCNV